LLKILGYFVFLPLVQTLRYILFPFSILYWLITTLRNYFYDVGLFKSTTFKTPVIVVGNLTVGGTGKTPMVEYLVNLLKNEYKLAILSRGYKRETEGFILANENSKVVEIGDEPYQYFNKFNNIKVAVDTNRKRGISKLLNLPQKPEVVILDDAFQHRKVKAKCNILLTTFKNLYTNDFLLPTGNLRESKTGAKRANIVVVTKCPPKVSIKEQEVIAKKLNLKKHQKLFFSRINYTNIKGASNLPLNELKNCEVLLVTGIANPNPLLQYLNEMEVSYKHLKYPDHYAFNTADIRKIENEFSKLNNKNSILLTTEKDYVRIAKRIKNLHYIAIENKIINAKEFENTIISYVG